MFTTYIHHNLCLLADYKVLFLWLKICIKTHDSESRGQEEAAVRNERVSYLHVRSTTLKFENAVAKPPRQLSLSYSGLSIFLD